MTGILPGTIIPWLLGGLGLLLVYTVSVTFKSWREAKRSPYYFLRVQAAKKLQSHAVVSAFLMILLIIAGLYAWRTPSDNTARLAVLRNAKPTSSVIDEAALEPDVVAEASPEIVTINLSDDVFESADSELARSDIARPAPQLEDVSSAESKINPETEGSEVGADSGTSIGPIYFSTDISSNYKAIDPGSRFTQGYFTLYATFDYRSMNDGTNWSWVWKRNGQAIDGGEQVWNYGDNGPGYVYFGPEEGFQPGEHSLEVWVEEQLMSQSNFTIIEGISASN